MRGVYSVGFMLNKGRPPRGLGPCGFIYLLSKDRLGFSRVFS